MTFVEKGIDFVGRGGSDNSIKGKIELQNFEPNEGNVLTASVVGCKFARYQPLPFYCSQNINKLKPVFENNRSRGLFFATLVQGFLNQFNSVWDGYKIDQLRNHEIIVPVINGEIDYDFIDSFISAIQKLIIKDVVLWADKKIEATKSVVNR